MRHALGDEHGRLGGAKELARAEIHEPIREAQLVLVDVVDERVPIPRSHQVLSSFPKATPHSHTAPRQQHVLDVGDEVVEDVLDVLDALPVHIHDLHPTVNPFSQRSQGVAIEGAEANLVDALRGDFVLVAAEYLVVVGAEALQVEHGAQQRADPVDDDTPEAQVSPL